jgi:hypothetical protein
MKKKHYKVLGFPACGYIFGESFYKFVYIESDEVDNVTVIKRFFEDT